MESGKREQQPRPSHPPQKKRRRRRVSVLGIIGRILLAIFTLALIGVLSLAIFFKIFMQYIDTSVPQPGGDHERFRPGREFHHLLLR